MRGCNLRHYLNLTIFTLGDLLLQFARRVGKTQREEKAASDGEAEGEREDGLGGCLKKIRKNTAFEFTRRERFVSVRKTPPFYSAVGNGSLPRSYDSIMEGTEEEYYDDEDGEEGGGDILVNQSCLSSNSSTASLAQLGCSIDDDDTFHCPAKQHQHHQQRVETEEQVGLCLTEIDSDLDKVSDVSMKARVGLEIKTDTHTHTLSRRTYSDCSATTTEECHTLTNACASDVSLVSNLSTSTSTSTSCTISISTSVTPSDKRMSIPAHPDDVKQKSILKNKNVFEDVTNLIQPTIIKAEKRGKQVTHPSLCSCSLHWSLLIVHSLLCSSSYPSQIIHIRSSLLSTHRPYTQCLTTAVTFTPQMRCYLASSSLQISSH